MDFAPSQRLIAARPADVGQHDWAAEHKRSQLEGKLGVTIQALLAHGLDEDVAAAVDSLARIAAKAMRRRAPK